jgi:hypothetical protein
MQVVKGLVVRGVFGELDGKGKEVGQMGMSALTTFALIHGHK